MLSKHLWWLLPAALMAFITPFISDWDQQIAGYFYQHHFKNHDFYQFFYSYAIYPALITSWAAFVLLVASYLYRPWKKWRLVTLSLVLTMVLGAGFIVHTVLKDHWGRPRPKQVVGFGGKQPFHPYYCPYFNNPIEPSKSFPCGHCTMGFYFFSAAFVCMRLGYRKGSYFFYFIALLLGGLLGLTRMAQGGHFLSDVLMTALIMWWTAGAVDWLLYGEEKTA